MTYCFDCPDREACHQGMSCEASKRFAAAALVYQEKMKGKKQTMANTEKKTATVNDVVAEATKDKLVAESVPAQKKETVEEKVEVKVEESTEDPKLTVIEGGKKSLKDRLADLGKKAKENKNIVIAVGATIVATSIAVAKVSAKKALEKEEAKGLVYDDEQNPPVDPITGEILEKSTDEQQNELFEESAEKLTKDVKSAKAKAA